MNTEMSPDVVSFPKFSDLEVIALGITAEAFGCERENLLLHRRHHACKEDLPNLINRRQFHVRNAGAKRCTMGRDNIHAAPDWGYCASQGMYYYGDKCHAGCGTDGVIHSYDLTAASVHDFLCLKDIYHDCRMLGEEGYLSAEVQKNLFEVTNIRLEVPYRLNQKNWEPPT